ncbi:MAG TPA: DNA repair and recombination protein RadA [Methanomassiliicoccales archaeon]|jgi:DNA repair protein RadA|nr:DNA repair and recombination protein RadA [Methanomassiliicoccales archaeon]MCE5261372.1 DNA repair and recombination protein RadA [Euryarchaeota archaeon]HOE52466.1 DNA repair and recombination protein RadA [Methanomassiliicoccales archaeon]HQM66375.1 DNA repair and recombination protein RadA [Methanomassiliicoccales archaeon]HRU11105.1 DNA repair and recombination protein RadA [Methanomassiliicoccales archaeon]
MANANIEELPGVGPATADKLREAGYTNLMTIAVESPKTLADACDIGEATAIKIIDAAKKAAEVGGFESGDVILERRRNLSRLTTSSKAFDELLGNGLESQSIVEFFGEFGSGKTQVCFQLAVNATLPKEKGGLDGDVVMIDTENTFRPERIVQIAKARDADPEEVLKRIHVARAYNSSHQMLLVEKAAEICKKTPVRLMIVDSLTAHFRAEFVGRGTLAERQGLLNKHMHELLSFAEVNNSVIAVTNQVSSKPDAFFGDPTRPVGGHVVAHASTYRLYLRKSKGNRRIARLIDSPDRPEAEAVFTVSEEGIRD